MSEKDEEIEPKPDELVEHICPHGVKYGDYCPECEFVDEHIWGV